MEWKPSWWEKHEVLRRKFLLPLFGMVVFVVFVLWAWKQIALDLREIKGLV